MHDTDNHLSRLRVGSLFSGYGGLDLAVEHAFNAQTIWSSEINQPVAELFAHHWPDAPNLGDITAIDWHQVEPVDILIGGFPCQDVSTAGKKAGLKPGTRSGLWSHMAQAIDALQPEWVVIENVRGLLSATAIRPPTQGDNDEQCNPDLATLADATLRDVGPDPWHLADGAARPLRAMGAVLGDLADLRMSARWVGIPAALIGAPHHRFRVFILAHRQIPHAPGLGLAMGRREPGARAGASGHDRALAPDHRLGTERAAWLSEQEQRIGDPVAPDRATLRRWGRYGPAIARWQHITGRQAPAPALLNQTEGPRPAPAFVEWLMGLPEGWVTDPQHSQLTNSQQITALGNGVLPLQAVRAIDSFRGESGQISPDIRSAWKPCNLSNADM